MTPLSLPARALLEQERQRLQARWISPWRFAGDAALEQGFRAWLRAHVLLILRSGLPILSLLYPVLMLVTGLQLYYLAAPEHRVHDLLIWVWAGLGLGLTTTVFNMLAGSPRWDRYFGLYSFVSDTLMLAFMLLALSQMRDPGQQQLLAGIVVMGVAIVFGTSLLRLLPSLLYAAAGLLAALLGSYLLGEVAALLAWLGFYGLVCLSLALLCVAVERSYRLTYLQECLLADDKAQLATLTGQLERQSRFDALTGLANRRHFDECLEQEWGRARREDLPLALLFIDVDHFKPYNDHYGHQQGDACLSQVAVALESVPRRPGDLVARYGGEEFVMLLPQTELAGAAEIGERALAVIANLALPHEQAPLGRVSVSIGVAAVLPAQLPSARELIRAADAALYEAKAAGRARLVRAPASGATTA